MGICTKMFRSLPPASTSSTLLAGFAESLIRQYAARRARAHYYVIKFVHTFALLIDWIDQHLSAKKDQHRDSHIEPYDYQTDPLNL